MRFNDMLAMSCANLWKRKVRTVLTILGVVIGVASIVVMVSLGLGLSKMSMEQVERFGGLTTITVSEAMSYESGTSDKNRKHLDDEIIKTISENPYVKAVEPVLAVYAQAKSGAYESNFEIRGMNPSGLISKNLKLADGELPLDNTEMSLLYGNMIIVFFYNPRSSTTYWESGVLPDVDLKNGAIFITFDSDSPPQSTADGEAGPVTTRKPKKHLAKYSGLLEGTPEDYSENAYRVYTNLEAMKNLLKKEFKGRTIPGQPTRSNGKPYKEIFYSELEVEVKELDHMKEVQEWIQELGFRASSNTEWIEQTRQQSGYIQAVLGGIGAVSLIVAAIGITNTMMMSIYERTREIGVMKVLGCDMGNIRNLFLMEAGFIGFFGGIIGIVLSVIISYIINAITVKLGIAEAGASLSYIPFWLVGAAIIFAVIVGMLSGFFPARRAMHLSPLAAIRNN